MKIVLWIVVIIELALLACAGWGVHAGNTQVRDLCTILIACNSVLVILTAKRVRKKRACCS